MARTEILATAVESSRGVLPILNELSRLRRYGRPYFLAAPVLIAMTLISRAAEAASVGLIVLFLQAALGDGLGEEPAEGVVRALSEWVDAATGGSLPVLGAAIGLAVLVRILADVVIGLVDSRAYAQISHAVRRDIHAQYFDVEFNYVASHDHADLINVVENESENVPEAFQAVLEIAQQAAAVVIFGVMVFLLSWQVGLIAGAGAALLVAVSHLLAAPIQRLNARAISQHRMLIQRVLIGLQGMRAIRAFAQEPAEKQRFGRASRKLGATHRRIDVLETWIDPINELGYLALMAAIVVAGLWFGPGASGTVAVLALLYRLQPHASALQSLAIKLVTMTPNLSMVRTVLDREDKSYPPSGEQAFEQLNREIAFEAVSMTYPGSQDAVLKEASFSIPAGRTTALLGPSGAGKTTVVNLLLGLYQPTSGAVLVDGTPLRALRRRDWLHRIAVAGQDVELIEGSVAANVRLSRPSASAAAVCEACRIAGILDDVESMPDGFATWIGERGARLSGGQRQRLGLARALLCDPDVLILDEATSALDDTLEQAIRTRLLRELEGRTIVLITHRLSTVAQVDHAVWLEGGRVVEEGAPRSLGRLKRASGEARRSPEIS